MATLVLLMSVLAIVGDSCQVACVALHRASPSLRLAESAMEMFGAAETIAWILNCARQQLTQQRWPLVPDAEPTSLWGIDKSADDEARMRLLLPREHERRNAIEQSLPQLREGAPSVEMRASY